MNLLSLFAMQQQVLTPSAADLIAKSGNAVLLQTPILLAALICLIVALLKLRRFRLVSALTILASLLMMFVSFVSPLVGVWLPFFFIPQQPQAMPDGTIVEPSLAVLQTNIFYANLIASALFAVALLIYLAAIFAARGKALGKLKAPAINIPTISIK